MHSQAISNALWDLLCILNAIPQIESCYLGGGTALAVHLEHRVSEDLDFLTVKGGEHHVGRSKTGFDQGG